MSRPNILLITSDQQHWTTLGVVNPEISTPNLDRLAAEGTRFTRAYCPNPTCTPTRASMITGQFPSQHGAWSLGTSLPESAPTVGDRLQGLGYRTALVGKAHFQPLASTERYPSLEAYPLLQDLAFWKRFHGPFYGFQHVELARNHTNEAHVGQHYALWMEERGFTGWREHFLPPTGTMDPAAEFTWPIPEEFHYDAWIAERSNRLLDEYAAAGEPFFLWASFFDPHPPYLAPEPWDTMYDPDRLTIPEAVPGEHDRNPPHFRMTQLEDPDFGPPESGQLTHGFHSHRRSDADRRKLVATYYGMVSLLDKYVGRILDRLEALGLADDTIVVFTTDHGHFFGQHGLQAKGPFHYEDLIRVPLVVRYPGRVPAGRVSDAIQSTADLTPTFLGFLGEPVPGYMTGIDQHAVWEGTRPAARDHTLVEFHHQPTTLNLRTYVDDRYKLTVYQGQEYGELFDLQEDPGELRNLWDAPEHADLRSRLLLRCLWAELAKEPMWMPRIAIA
ncbi:sulfatase family protein [Nonomuraea aridisoli]|uniref:Sulfatase n=1 Tax=Nonomuraea aridisoli TaxID=2070368 RepID=A0A2W2DSV8_9ACTN|nr:sulfatase-like hydrolase/transferase [Nonomuraea aridisoli]PZG13291.1 sulfatase [Nonomuraea aridisoli]